MENMSRRGFLKKLLGGAAAIGVASAIKPAEAALPPTVDAKDLETPKPDTNINTGEKQSQGSFEQPVNADTSDELKNPGQ